MFNVVYPGSFDPVSFGHLDIIERASKLFAKVYIVIAYNPLKKESTFTLDERVQMLRLVTRQFKNIEISVTDGLIGDFAKQVGAKLIIKGIRNQYDFDNELSQYQYNRILHPDLETAVFFASKEHLFISSSGIRELASFHGDLTAYVPKEIIPLIEKKYKR